MKGMEIEQYIFMNTGLGKEKASEGEGRFEKGRHELREGKSRRRRRKSEKGMHEGGETTPKRCV